MDIKGSVILITSAGTKLGKTLISHFSRLGAHVIAIDTDPIPLKTITNDNVLAYPIADYSDQTIRSLFSDLVNNRNISIDILINYWPSTPLPMLTSEDTANDFSSQLCLLAAPIFSFGQACAEHMRDSSKKKLIINMITFPFENNELGFESASSMVSGFTKSWAKELAPFNIRVGGVIPGVAHTVEHNNGEHWAIIQDELIRSTEYIVCNEYFNGRVMAAEM
ncbi:SDR family oxidoreductase [Vibrio sp. TH_r3]|uniref:SDR family oxidoreductase n=1 Tax=Vibrio sp. TH_r3 TaxID=3082084 RepID=UPI002955CD56|nr:SDR family oxidoreductase [Vibrio sp. TH_r3]MDV7103131.1 SDR family oxidoreductase [Vibrio sp. TH_r3]